MGTTDRGALCVATSLLLLFLSAFCTLAATIAVPTADSAALIAAIIAANAAPGGDTIELEGGTYSLTTAYGNFSGPTGLPNVSSEIVIRGNGSVIERSTQEGTPDFRILHVEAGARLTLEDMTLRGGGMLYGNYGGAICSQGVLTVSNTTLSYNTAGYGGAIWNDGTLTVLDSQLSDNWGSHGSAIENPDGGTADIRGTVFTSNAGSSAIRNHGVLDITASTFSGHADGAVENRSNATVVASTFSANDRAILNCGTLYTSASMTVADTTFAANTGSAIKSCSACSMDIRDSTFTGNSAFAEAGAILNEGSMLLAGCVLSGNTADAGGAIKNAGAGTGGLTITGCELSANTGNHGGAIYSTGSLEVRQSTFFGNVANNGGALATGARTANVAGSTFWDNSATVSGGAVYTFWGGTVRLTNCTLAGNSANYGGAIYNSDAVSTVNSTLHGNSALYDGGGIYNKGTLEIKGTILAENFAGGNLFNSGGVITSGGYNLSDDSTCSPYFSAAGDVNGVDPLLGTLADNGGLTETIRIRPESPCIDAIPVGSCTNFSGLPIATDQRGEFRPLGSACDMGAYEATECTGLTLLSVSPDRGGNSGYVDVVITGGWFQDGIAVELRGASTIIAQAVAVTEGGTVLTCSLDLDGSPVGPRDLAITNPDGGTATLAQAFTIEAGEEAEISANILGPHLIRAGRGQRYYIAYENTGNTTAYAVPILLIVGPADMSIEVDVPVLEGPALGSDPIDPAEYPDVWQFEDKLVLPSVISKVPPGGRFLLPFTVTSSEDFDLRVAVQPQLISMESEGGETGGCSCAIRAPTVGQIANCVFDVATFVGTVIPVPPVQCVSGILRGLKQFLLPKEPNQIYNYTAIVGGAVLGCIPAVQARDGIKVVYKLVTRGAGGLSIWDSCSGIFSNTQASAQTTHAVQVVSSIDPNEKNGPTGAGAQRFVRSDRSLQYEILFENLETATAPAQEVLITDCLDAATLDTETLTLGPITFGRWTVTPPPGVNSYTTNVDLRPDMDLLVNIRASFDQPSGLLTWRFVSIDPETGLLPVDPLAGFLPPNLVPPEGDGSVTFSAMPVAGIATGTRIENTASIVFDANPSIDTPEWVNTVDRDLPTSSVQPLPSTVGSLSTEVAWVGNDPTSGVDSYHVYVAEGEGPFELWKTTSSGSAVFSGRPGTIYSFFSIAFDQAGNSEPMKTAAEASTEFEVGFAVLGAAGRYDVYVEGTLHAQNFLAGSADVAEWVTVSGPVELAEVLVFDEAHPGAYRRSSGRACSPLVAGAVSAEPGITLGGSGGGDALLALIGIVLVKVTDEGGPIMPGDLLVSSSTPGHAMRWAGHDPCPCALVGKALESMNDRTGVILVLLTAH